MCREHRQQAYHASARSGKAAAGAGAADRAAAVGGVALDAAEPTAAGRSRRSWRASRSATPAPRIPAPGATTPPRWPRCRPGTPTASAYILTEADPFAAIDLDHCRHADTHSIDVWAQNFLDVGRHTYSEVTPSRRPAAASGV